MFPNPISERWTRLRASIRCTSGTRITEGGICQDWVFFFFNVVAPNDGAQGPRTDSAAILLFATRQPSVWIRSTRGNCRNWLTRISRSKNLEKQALCGAAWGTASLEPGLGLSLHRTVDYFSISIASMIIIIGLLVAQPRFLFLFVLLPFSFATACLYPSMSTFSPFDIQHQKRL